MGKSIEDLEKEINELYDKLNKLNKIDYNVKEIAEAKTTIDGKKFSRDEKTKKLNSILRTYGDKFTNLYDKLSILCFNWSSRKFHFKENHSEDIEKTKSSDYGLELVQVLPVCLVSFDSKEKDKKNNEIDFVKYLTSKLHYTIKDENARQEQEDRTNGMQTKRDILIEKVLSYKKNYCPQAEINSPEMRNMLKEKMNFSDKKINSIMEKMENQNVISLNCKVSNDPDSDTLDDMLEDKSEEIIETSKTKENLESKFEKINELYNSTKAGQKNKSALYTYSVLKTLLLYDLNFIKEMIEKYDFLKSNEKAILYFANDKEEISKKSFAKISGVPVAKLSDKKMNEDLKDFLRNSLHL